MTVEIRNRHTNAVIHTVDTETLAGVDLVGADLRGADLWGADLWGANLGSAYLEGANLAGANLAGANLEGAYLEGANLEGANLRGTNLRGANLGGANLEGANLAGADLAGACLVGANLMGTNLRGANLRDADLTGAGAYLGGTTINWMSHDLVAEILRQHMGDSLQRRLVAGGVLISHDWCWDDFLKIRHRERKWALDTLAKYVRAGDNAPDELRERAAKLNAAKKGKRSEVD